MKKFYLINGVLLIFFLILNVIEKDIISITIDLLGIGACIYGLSED